MFKPESFSGVLLATPFVALITAKVFVLFNQFSFCEQSYLVVHYSHHGNEMHALNFLFVAHCINVFSFVRVPVAQADYDLSILDFRSKTFSQCRKLKSLSIFILFM